VAWKYSFIALLFASSASALDIDVTVHRPKTPMIVTRAEPVVVVEPIITQCVKLQNPVARILAFWRWFKPYEREYTSCVAGSRQIVDHYEITAVSVTGERVTFDSAVSYPTRTVIYY
jgi:hypothetical protein